MSFSKIALGGARKRSPPTSNGVKRSRAALEDDEDEQHDLGRSENVSHFDRNAGGAIDESQPKEATGPLIIPKQSNRNWKEAANMRKRQKSELPSRENGTSRDMDQKMKDVEAADAAKKPGFGLNLYQNQPQGNGNQAQENGHVQEASTQQQQAIQDPKRKTDDELAMDALLGQTSTDETLVIEQALPLSEADAFRHDYADAPDMATLDEYARVPVEQFGAAMLRGMGWKDGEGIGSQRGKKLAVAKDGNKPPERRAALLGIGAKEDASLAREMGAWGKAAQRGKEVKIYNPVLLRDKKTGQLYTEEELQRKRERDERARYEEEFGRNERTRERRPARVPEREGREGRRRDAPDENRRRDRSPDRDGCHRERERERDRDRDRRKRSEDSDEEYYRRKEKERSQRKERKRDDRDGDYDRDRSRRHRDRHREYAHDDDRHRRRDKDPKR